MVFGADAEGQGQVRASHRGATEVEKGAGDGAITGTLSRAGSLSSDILDLQEAKHGLDARVVTAVGEIDALAAPELVVAQVGEP